MKVRGIRNNNPGNIRHGDKWEGLSDIQSDSSFCVFQSPVYGIRAMAKILLNYQEKYQIDTIEKIISRWAPPNENDTLAYVHSVASALNVSAKQKVDLHGNGVLLANLIKAIIKHENGRQPYDDDMIFEGIRLAGVKC